MKQYWVDRGSDVMYAAEVPIEASCIQLNAPCPLCDAGAKVGIRINVIDRRSRTFCCGKGLGAERSHSLPDVTMAVLADPPRIEVRRRDALIGVFAGIRVEEAGRK